MRREKRGISATIIYIIITRAPERGGRKAAAREAAIKSGKEKRSSGTPEKRPRATASRRDLDFSAWRR